MIGPGGKLNIDTVETSASYLLRRASRRFKEAITPILKQNGLSSLELTTMSLIQTNESCILRTLADAVGVEPPAMNRIVNSLEDKRLATRHKSPKDSRYSFFELTETGVERLKTTSAAFEQAERDILAVLTESQRQKFIRCLQRFE